MCVWGPGGGAIAMRWTTVLPRRARCVWRVWGALLFITQPAGCSPFYSCCWALAFSIAGHTPRKSPRPKQAEHGLESAPQEKVDAPCQGGEG